MTVTRKQKANGKSVNEFKNIDNLELIDKLGAHVSFIKEVLYVGGCPGIEYQNMGYIFVEVRDRIDKIESLIEEVWERLKHSEIEGGTT